MEQGWNLLSEKQKVMQSKKDEVFNDRYKDLQKMNKLRKILFAKNKDISNKFNSQILTKTLIDSKKPIIKRKPQFLYMALTFMSSKN